MTLSEKIIKTSDVNIQKSLREIDADCLVHLAVFNLTEEAFKRILQNMSARAVTEIQKDIEDYKKRMRVFEKNIDKYYEK